MRAGDGFENGCGFPKGTSIDAGARFDIMVE